jgi:hypothetical protein
MAGLLPSVKRRLPSGRAKTERRSDRWLAGTVKVEALAPLALLPPPPS